jgi:hypothetical protein
MSCLIENDNVLREVDAIMHIAHCTLDYVQWLVLNLTFNTKRPAMGVFNVLQA